MKQIDLTRIIKKYTSGWIALSPDYKKVVGHGKTIEKATKEALINEFKDPILMRGSRSYGPIAP